MTNHKSFTLIELLVVIAIIGVLSAIVITSISGAVTKSRIVRLQVFSDTIRAQLSDSLVSYWSFNEGIGTDAKDMWEGNNGTLGGGTPDYYPTWKSGGECVSGSCLEFDGINDYIDCGSISSASAGTMESWIKPSGVYNGNRSIMGGSISSGASVSSRYNLTLCSSYFGSGNWYTTIANGTTHQGVNSGQLYNSTNFPVSTWTNLIITYDGLNVSFYKDSVLINTVEQTVSAMGDASPFSIGRIGAFNGFYFSGLLDEVHIYNSAASITQIQSQYLAGLDKLLSNGAISKSEYNQKIKELSKSLVIE